ncbi:MAG: hypothetical protein HYY30_10555 [Chloroflexi bacterium]|nr:hypothetical protein [Chloroflexota bacterium]
MNMESAQMQVEQLKSQMAELRAKMDELASGQQVSAKAQETMEQARQAALDMGQRVAERKGTFIPLGTLALMVVAVFAVMTFFPDFGARTTEAVRRMWREYTGGRE